MARDTADGKLAAAADIPFGKPLIGESEREAVLAVLSGTTLVHGSVTHEFEERFARRIGAKHAVSVSSCTALMPSTVSAAPRIHRWPSHRT